MRSKKSIMSIKIILVLGFVFFVFPENVYAYVDPGSGSYLLQIVLGLFLGGLFSMKTFMKKIINPFAKKNIDEKKQTKRATS